MTPGPAGAYCNQTDFNMTTNTDDDAFREEVLRLDGLRCKALVERDERTLARIYDDEMSYMHSQGRPDTKAGTLEYLRSQVVRYRVIERESVQCRIIGSVGVVEGVVFIAMDKAGQIRTFRNHYLAVWHRAEGHPTMVAFAATRLP